MPSTRRINVTQEKINDGDRTAPNSCPIALALREAFPEATGVFVVPGDMEVETDTETLYIAAANEGKIEIFVTNFDDGVPVKPFSMDVTAYTEDELRKGTP